MEAEFEREVLDRLIKIEGKLDGYNNAKVKTYENEKEILRIKRDLEDVQKTVKDLTESNKWLYHRKRFKNYPDCGRNLYIDFGYHRVYKGDRLPGQDSDKVPGSYSVPCNLRDRLLCLPVLRVNRVRVVLPGSRHFRGVHRGDRVL